MTIRRDVVCGICGLVACVCANAGTVSEGAHPHQRESRKVEALPPEQDHTHQDFDRAVRIEDVGIGVTRSSGTLPPGRFVTDSQPYRRPHYPDASFVFGTPPVLVASGSPPAGRFIQTSS